MYSSCKHSILWKSVVDRTGLSSVLLFQAENLGVKGRLIMKLYVFALVIVAASAFAVDVELGERQTNGSGASSIDELVYSQTYDFDELLNGFSNPSFLDRRVCDDFVLAGPDFYIDEIVVWMIWTGGQASTMNLAFSEDTAGDSDPNTATEVWAEAVPCTNVFTGDIGWGFYIYETTCDINETGNTPELEIGAHYYFETQGDTGDNCYILVTNPGIADCTWFYDGSGVWVRTDVYPGLEFTADMFFDFCSFESALESATWAEIKTLF